MKILSILTLITAVVPSASLAQQNDKVGTFHRGSIVTAYYNSEHWTSVVREKKEAQSAARAAGDQAKVAELERWGQASQKLAHEQLAGKAPIDNIMEAIRPLLAGIASKAGVREVLADPPKGAATVDVTDALLDALKAEARTRKWAEELRGKR